MRSEKCDICFIHMAAYYIKFHVRSEKCDICLVCLANQQSVIYKVKCFTWCAATYQSSTCVVISITSYITICAIVAHIIHIVPYIGYIYISPYLYITFTSAPSNTIAIQCVIIFCFCDAPLFTYESDYIDVFKFMAPDNGQNC